MRIIIILFISLFTFRASGQSDTTDVSGPVTKLAYSGLNNLTEQGKISFLAAISNFPELTSSRIQLKYKRIRTTMCVRPTIGSLIFNRRENRKYIIRINSSVQDSVITLNELSSDAQVGLLGHELSHIVDYQSRNIWGVISRGFAYMTRRGKAKYEREIDIITIKHGLGRPLYQWSNYVLHGSDASAKYKLFKSSIYMMPEEIRDLDNAETLTPH